MQSLVKDTVPEFVDPVTKKMMLHPVVLSTGLIIDNSTAIDKTGRVKYRYCPVTHKKLTTVIHPVNILHDKIVQWNSRRLDTALILAQKYKDDQEKLKRICSFAN